MLNLLKTQVRPPSPYCAAALTVAPPSLPRRAQAVLWHLDPANFDYDAYLEALDRLFPRPAEGAPLDAATVRENVLRNSLDVERVVAELAGAAAPHEAQDAVRGQTITATLDRHYGASAVVPRLHSYVDEVMSSAFGPPVLARVRPPLGTARLNVALHTNAHARSLPASSRDGKALHLHRRGGDAGDGVGGKPNPAGARRPLFVRHTPTHTLPLPHLSGRTT